VSVLPPPDGGDEAPAAPRRDHVAGGAARRLLRAWRALHGDQRMAALAALALFLALLLPWYSTSPTAVAKGQSAVSSHHNALSTFGWVEAAVLLVAAGVLLLLFARAERRAFHLPGGDGGVIAAAGVWAAFLIVWRFFDKPDLGRGVAVGLQWGIFVALGFAAILAYGGSRIRAAQRPEPPLEHPPRQDGAPAPAPGTVRTRPLVDEPGDAQPAPGQPTTALPPRGEPD
jgi:hypothetical protein